MSLTGATRKKIAASFRRLETLPFMPAEAAYKALFRVFCDLADDEEHGERILTALLDEPLGEKGEQRWPTGYDIRQAAKRTRRKATEPDPACVACSGMGFRPTAVERNGVLYSGSEKCDCWREVEREEVCL